MFYKDAYACTFMTSGPTPCWDQTLGGSYSNYGFELLGDALAEPVGSTWPTVNVTEIMSPFVMSHTLTYLQFKDDPALLAYYTHHAAKGHVMGPSGPSSIAPIEVDAWGAAAGALWSSLDEMVVWLKYNMGYAVGTPTLRALLPQIRQGLGWGVSAAGYCSPGSGPWIAKDGAHDGFNSYIGYEPNTGRGVIVLVNDVAGIQSATDMATYLMDQLP